MGGRKCVDEDMVKDQIGKERERTLIVGDTKVNQKVIDILTLIYCYKKGFGYNNMKQ